MARDAVDPLLRHEPQALQQSRDARHVVGPCLQPVRQLLRHVLQKGLGAGASLQQRLSLVAAQQQPRPLWAVQPLVPRHGNERRAQLPHGHRQHPRRLGSVQHEGHAPPAAQRRDALRRQAIAEHVGHMGADHRVRSGVQRLLKLRQHGLRSEQRRVDDGQLNIGDAVERPRHRVVLVTGDDHAASGLHQRFDGDVQPMGGAGCEHHACGVLHIEQRCRQTAAPEIRLLRQPRGGIAAPPGRAHGRCGAVHGAAHPFRLL